MSVKTYAYNDTTQLTAHFNVKEFKCKCGKEHNILISEELVQMLENLRDTLACSKIIINSGYRCTSHDKAVGGSGAGQHTKGTAADVVCYDKDGQPISSKLVCCTAQDLGFTGIANITSAYTSTHLDVRTGSKYYGDETRGTSTVTSDFYGYFGVSTSQKSTDIEKSNATFGIDVSEYQGNVNWSHVKTDGVKFAIIRTGIGTRIDNQFANNYAGCKSNGIPVGAYWYSKATTVEDAKHEAQAFLSALKGKTFEYPVYMDLEEKAQFSLGKEKCSELVIAFLTVLEQAGYFAGLYCSASYLISHITESVRNRYAIWCADYRGKCGYTDDYGIWQHSVAGHPKYDVFGKGSIYGIDTQCDLDYAYKDYPTIIKSAGLNGFSKSVEENDDTSSTDSSDKTSTSNSDTLEQILEHIKSIDEKLG